MSIIKEIHVPDIGDFKGVDIIEVMVAAGDVIEVETPLIILETDKASMEVPSPLAGLVREVKVKPGDKISQGDPILYLEIQESVTLAEPASAAADEATPAASATGCERNPRSAVPDIGDFKSIPVIEVLVAPGDRVDMDTPLVTLESDKASMDIPSPFAGTVQAVELKVGDKVSQGDLILLLDDGGGFDRQAAIARHAQRHCARPACAQTATCAARAASESAASQRSSRRQFRQGSRQPVNPPLRPRTGGGFNPRGQGFRPQRADSQGRRAGFRQAGDVGNLQTGLAGRRRNRWLARRLYGHSADSAGGFQQIRAN
jgi:pyruvate dehydrogenase E2 component (dihydrolipoamide acetyltransferase)